MSNETQISINKKHPAVHELHSALARSVDTTLDDTKKWAALESAARGLLTYIDAAPCVSAEPMTVPARVAIRIGANESVALPVVGGRIDITAADIAALAPPAAAVTDRYTVDAVAWEGFIADWNRYFAGDPKMPFVQIREGLVAVIDSAVPG